MLSVERIQKEHGGRICRRCINELYRTRLKPNNCLYDGPYPRVCPVCGETHHIVYGFTVSGSLKVLFK